MRRLAPYVLAAAATLFLWDLGGHDLWAPDEPYFAEGAREMVVDGEWAVPHVVGEITTDKPPLFFWLIALFSLPFGAVSELTARLPSALAGLGTVALTIRLGRRFHGPRTGALAGAVLATTYLFWEKSRWSQIDALLCCLIWVALSAFEAHRTGDAEGRRAGWIFWIAAALAVLAKGPVGLLLPLGMALVILAWDRDLARWRSFAPWSGPLLFSLVIGAWMALATLGSGGEYSVWGALREHFLERGMHGMHHPQPFWYFAETLPPNLLPWTLLVPGAILLAWRRRAPQDRFALSVVGFVLLFFSLSTEKRELYALPAFPAFALLVAGLVGAAARLDTADPLPVSRRWVTMAQGALGAVLLLAGVALPVAAARRPEIPAATAWAIGALIAATGLATLIAASRGRALGAALAPAAGIAATYLCVVTLVYPGFEGRKSARAFAGTVERHVGAAPDARDRAASFRIGNVPRGIAFYTGGLYLRDFQDPESFAEWLSADERRWAAVDGDELERLPAAILERVWVVERTRLSRQPVLLVTNQELEAAERLVGGYDPADPSPDGPTATAP